MKTSKKPSKEPSLPSQDESRRTNVLMEQMLSKFDAFGEVQSDLRNRVCRIETDLHTVKEGVAVLEAAAYTHTQEVRSLKETVQGNTEAIHAVQTDLKSYNQRLEVVENKLAS